MTNSNPIGVFDSGVGGLTVLQALREQLPNENFVYLGDTARLPYGTKGPETVVRYAKRASEILLARDIKFLVVACNTAATLALTELQKQIPQHPVVGVVEPSAQAAFEASEKNCIAVIATEATVEAAGYQRAIHAIQSDIEVFAQSASLLVALAEEGWKEGPIVEAVLQEYLEPLLALHEDKAPDCLLLGCTHFPILMPAIRKVIPSRVKIIDSATATAQHVANVLQAKNLETAESSEGDCDYLVTDCPSRFQRVAKHFMKCGLEGSSVTLVDST